MSNDIVIKVENLSKLYRLGELHKQTNSFREKVTTFFRYAFSSFRSAQHAMRSAPCSMPGEPETIWALRDVSFEVKRGEIVGIIGHNGAGKTTLLKILSRITKPTEGKAWINGRVGSLLEVGTGFHAELTGRENIFLNGAILGMTKAEIRQKFDEIVDFAEVEKFIDTPVKRYSSGMYVRLAFAVAAHLEPEILLVDEVLAVGDIAFQERCLGKMGSVAEEGRTILFVSHNIRAILSLCSRTILINRGQIHLDGASNKVVNTYHQEIAAYKVVPIAERNDRKGNQCLKILDFYLQTMNDDKIVSKAVSGQDLKIVFRYDSGDCKPLEDVHVSIGIYSKYNEKLLHLATNVIGKDFDRIPSSGILVCKIPRIPLQPGKYSFNFFITVGTQIADCVREAGIIDVVPGGFLNSETISYDPSRDSGYFFTEHYWQAE